MKEQQQQNKKGRPSVPWLARKGRCVPSMERSLVYSPGARHDPGTTAGLYRVTSQESYQAPGPAPFRRRSSLTSKHLPWAGRDSPQGMVDRGPQGGQLL